MPKTTNAKKVGVEVVDAAAAAGTTGPKKDDDAEVRTAPTNNAEVDDDVDDAGESPSSSSSSSDAIVPPPERARRGDDAVDEELAEESDGEVGRGGGGGANDDDAAGRSSDAVVAGGADDAAVVVAPGSSGAAPDSEAEAAASSSSSSSSSRALAPPTPPPDDLATMARGNSGRRRRPEDDVADIPIPPPRSVVAPTIATSNPAAATTASASADDDAVRRRRTTTTTTIPSAPVARSSSSSSSDALLPPMSDDDSPDAGDALLAMSFNQDGGCLAVGTGSGFRICNVNPFQETFRRTLGCTNDAVVPSSSSSGGGGGGGGTVGRAGIARIEMLYRTNLLALTGHAASPNYPPNKVYLYDDHLQRPIGELTFRQRVLTTRLRRDRIVVALRDRVYVYNFSDLTLLDKVHTGDNPLGLIGISTDNGGVGGITAVPGAGCASSSSSSSSSSVRNNGMVLACPGTQRGQVRVELYGLRRTTFVDAHESALGALALSADGSLLATASERGTVVRLFDTRGTTVGGGGGGGGGGATAATSSSTPLREFRRGVDRATISCLTFSLDSAWLGCASDHGTVHVFRTQESAGGSGNAANAADAAASSSSSSSSSSTKKSRSSSMTGKAMRMLPRLLVTSPTTYLMDGVQSFAQVRGVPHPRACAFVPDRERTIAVAGLDEYGNGCLLLAEFGCKIGGDGGDGGVGEGKADDSEARRVGYHRFFKCKSPASQTGRRRTKNKDRKIVDDAIDGGAYIDESPVDMRMNHISFGDENEDDFVPIDYSNKN